MVSVHTGYWSSVHITLSKVIYLVILLSGSKLLNRCVLTVIVLTCFFTKGVLSYCHCFQIDISEIFSEFQEEKTLILLVSLQYYQINIVRFVKKLCSQDNTTQKSELKNN